MPVRTGARSRAVDDRVRSLSSSDPGSAIECFRQKIPLHHQLTDLGMKLRQLNVAVLLAGAALLVEHLGEFLNRLALPRCNLGRVQFVLGRQLGDRLLALDRLKRHLGFELSRKSSPRPHGDSSSVSANPPYRAVSGSGTTSERFSESTVVGAPARQN